MVNKQVETRIAELRAEFHLMNHELRQQMTAELKKQLREEVSEKERESPQDCIMLDKDQEEEENLMSQTSLSSYSSDTHAYSDYMFKKSTKWKQNDDFRNLCNASSDSDSNDGDISDNETRQVSTEAHNSSKQAECCPKEDQRFSPYAPTVFHTIQQMKKSEEEASKRDAFYANFMVKELRSEKNSVHVDRTKEEQALLMERQWKEWLDKQEVRGNQSKEMPHDPQNTEKQGRVGPHVSAEKQMKQKPKGGQKNPAKKIRTYLSDFFSPLKWERLEEDD